MTDPHTSGSRLVGVIVMTCGALVTLLAGICSIAVLSGGSSGFTDIAVVAAIAVVPVVAGAFTFWVGFLIYRGPPTKRPPDDAPPPG